MNRNAWVWCVVLAVVSSCSRVEAPLDEPRDEAASARSEALMVDPAQDVDPVVQGPAPGSQAGSVSASNGTVTLVAWGDERGAVYLARLSSTGTLLDTTNIRLPSTVALDAMASDGANFMLVGQNAAGTTIGFRVSGAGVPLDAAPFNISAVGTGSGFDPTSVAFDGTNYLVTWAELTTGRDVFARFIAPTGAPVGAAFNLIRGSASDLAAFQSRPSVAFGGGTYLVSWLDQRVGNSVWGALVTPAGVVTGNTNFQIRGGVGGGALEPRVAFNTGAAQFLVVWTTGSAAEGQRVTTAGVLAGGLTVLSDVSASSITLPSVASNATDWLVTWTDTRGTDPDLIVSRVTSAGADIADVGFVVNTPALQGFANLSAMGASYVVTWGDNRVGNYDIMAARADVNGARLDPSDLLVSLGANRQRAPQVAFDPNSNTWLVVWADERAGQSDILGMRFDATGARVGSTISIATGPNVELEPDVALDGPGYLVVWEDRGPPCFVVPCLNPVVDIHARRVTNVGATPTPSFAISTAAGSQLRPRVASTGNTALVVWSDARTGAMTNLDIYGARVSGTNVLDAMGISILTFAGVQEDPDVTGAGTQFFVTWADQRAGGASTYKIYGARVNATNGMVVDTSGLLISDIAGRLPFEPAATTNGADYVIAWTSVTGGPNRVYARRLSSSGIVQGTSETLVSSSGREVALTFDGTNYLAAYRDYLLEPLGGDISALRLDSALAPLGSNFSVAAAADTDAYPAIAAGSMGRVMTAWERDPDNSANIFTQRVKVARITRDANGAACTSASDCQSGFCVDGVCCNTTCGAGSTTDCQACSVAAGAAVNGTCAPRSNGTVCRAANGACDAAESCNGTSTACPPDGFASATTVCRAATLPCDVEERCTGGSTLCPTDALAPNTTVCRGAMGVCDAEERCSGSSATCPADGKLGSSTVCRVAAGTCDAVERCGSAGDNCPADALVAAGTSCRAVAGLCDVQETCNGTSAMCPNDAFAPAMVACRASVGECDVADSCSGASAICPADQFQPNGTPCSIGVCGGGTCFDPDAGVPDAGFDAGLAMDAGVDAGEVDAGSVVDAGTPDAGTPVDAGVADAGVADAGVADAGIDAGVDAGTNPMMDAGTMMPADAGTEPTTPMGCGCSSGADVAGLALMLALAVRRRRHQLR